MRRQRRIDRRLGPDTPEVVRMLQEEVREQRNPGWRQQLRMHREVLGLDPETGKEFHVEQKLALGEGSEQGS